MELYFAQHGRAASEEEDPDRPLTDPGRLETRRVARTLAAADVEVGRIWHSGKLRARQTAEIFAAALEPSGGVEARDGLGPTDDPGPVVDAASETGDAVLLVGHKPFMSRLPALLLAGDPDRGLVDVRHSGVVALRRADGSWTLRWSLSPELARAP